MKCQTR